MKYSVVYSSQTGNTAMLAETIRSSLPQEDVVYFGAPCEEALFADRIYAGFWTDRGGCDEAMAEFLKKLANRQVFLFGTAGFGQNSEYFDKVLAKAETNLPESADLVGSYMCQGKMPMAVRERYMKMQAQPNPSPNLDMMIRNFDSALSHPDGEDLEKLKEKLAETL